MSGSGRVSLQPASLLSSFCEQDCVPSESALTETSFASSFATSLHSAICSVTVEGQGALSEVFALGDLLREETVLESVTFPSPEQGVLGYPFGRRKALCMWVLTRAYPSRTR